MKILHLCRSPLAGAPVRLSNFLNKNGIESKCIQSRLSSMKVIPDVVWGKGKEDLKQFKEYLNWADIIHIHNQPPLHKNSEGWQILSNINKPFVYQMHGEPEKVISEMFNVIKKWVRIDRIACIAQYQAVRLKSLLKDDFYSVRNVVDICDPLLQYKEVNNEKIKVTYSPSNKEPLEKLKKKRKSTWAYKSYSEVSAILNELESKGIIEKDIIYGERFDECLKRRASGDIHIDDIYTGSYHLSSLEGLSQGKVVMCNLKDWMIQYLTGLSLIHI